MEETARIVISGEKNLSRFHGRIAAGVAALLGALLAVGTTDAATSVHVTWLWHMHQPIYWPAPSTWTPARYETAYETITLGHSQSDVAAIFAKDDRVGDYQVYPRDAVASLLDLPDAGAQVSFAGALVENLGSLAAAGWNGGIYAPDWSAPYREARGWTTGAGRPRLEPLLVGFHHAIGPLLPEAALRMELALQRRIYPDAWGPGAVSRGFFPAEMCFSERMIPALADAGVLWVVVSGIHLARACAGYPYDAGQDNCDPPNPADAQNPAQTTWRAQTISRGVTVKTPVPFGFTPHRARYVDPATGAADTVVVVPAADAMGWDEGYGLYGTGDLDAIAPGNDPARPMLVLLAHDGDNAWSGGYSYYYENVSQFAHAAAAAGYRPTTVATYLQQHPVPADDVVHVEDGGWVNADGDFGSPQFINWNWPLVDQAGQFDIPGGWAEDERNWAVLTAAQNVVETAAAVAGVDTALVLDPAAGPAGGAERGWHFLLAGYESGYMYYGTSLDMEIKATLACNAAVAAALPVTRQGPDNVGPTVWLPQRLPWNPGGRGGGSLWGYPGGAGAIMPRDFHVWTFVHDLSGVARVELMLRGDRDGVDSPADDENQTYAGGPGVTAWQALPMTRRPMPRGEPWDVPGVDLTVLPDRIADEYWVLVAGLQDTLVDYYVEAEDSLGNVTRSPIQHVRVGGLDSGETGDPVTVIPAAPAAGDSVTIVYDPVGRPLDGAAAVLLHRGYDGWQSVTDVPMSRAAPDSAWRVTFPLPAAVAQLDFVFTDGAGRWDNNDGRDWHVSVSGGQPPAFVMDGELDAAAVLLEECASGRLWTAVAGDVLYLATDAPQAAEDAFLLLAVPGAPTVAAPWAKAGLARQWDAFLAREADNGWTGWFGADGQLLQGVPAEAAAGTVLEGTVDLAALYPGGAPAELALALGLYATPDGGALAGQCPAGDGDADLTADADFTPLFVPTAAPALSRALSLAAAPNPFNPATVLRLRLPAAGRAAVAVYDLAGRRVRRLAAGWWPAGERVLRWDGRDDAGRALPSGRYVVRVVAGDRRAGVAVTLLK